MATVIIILGFILGLVGLAGCVLPFLPGPPLNFAALILLSLVRDWEPFGAVFLVSMGILTAGVTVLDYVVPAIGARRFGASKAGVWGSVIGMIVGLVLFPPWGMLIGAFVGALVGELIAGKEGKRALRAGWGTFVGTMVGTGIKLAASGIMFYVYVREMF